MLTVQWIFATMALTVAGASALALMQERSWPGHDEALAMLVIGAVVGCLSAFVLVAQRRLARAPLRGTSAGELAVSDILLTKAMRDLAAAGLLLGFVAATSVPIVFGLSEWLANAAAAIAFAWALGLALKLFRLTPPEGMPVAREIAARQKEAIA
jgi:hypothetical protein